MDVEVWMVGEVGLEKYGTYSQRLVCRFENGLERQAWQD